LYQSRKSTTFRPDVNLVGTRDRRNVAEGTTARIEKLELLETGGRAPAKSAFERHDLCAGHSSFIAASPSHK
jgi:hypothetical protein